MVWLLVSYPKLKLLGFLLRRGLLDILKDIKTYALSTGLRSRHSGGTYFFNIDSGVDIPVMFGFAVFASPKTVMEFQFGIYSATDIAFFTGRKETVNPMNGRTINDSFVLTLFSKHAPTAVTDRLSQTVILDHAFNVEVFQPNSTVGCGQSVAQFVEEVFSLVGNFFMQPGNLQPHFSPVCASFFLLGKLSLKPGKFFFGFSQANGVSNLFTSGKDCKIRLPI
jgi:hypothetical protein